MAWGAMPPFFLKGVFMDKIKNNPVFKFIIFGLTISILFCSSSFLITSAGAESTVSDTLDLTDLKDGMLGEYPVVNSFFSEGLLTAYFNTTSEQSNITYDFYLPFVYHNKKLYFADELSCITYNRLYFDGLNSITYNLGGNVVFNPLTAKKDFSSSSRSDDFHNIAVSLSGTTFTYLNAGWSYTCTFNFTSSSGDVLSPNGDYSIMFARVASTKNANTVGSASSYISSSLKYSEYSYSAKFLHLSTKEDDPRIKLNFIDHIVAKNQYPTFDLQINDNGMHYSYSVRVGVNTQYASQIEQFWLNEDTKQQFSSNTFGVFIPNNASTFVQTFKYAVFLTQCDAWAYDYITTISSELFSFGNSDVASRIYSLNLSDYISVLKFNIYRLEIVCNETSQVLSTTYFTCPRSYSRSESGYGVKSYDYSSSSGADVDSSSGNYTGNFTQGLTGSSSNPNDIVSNAFKDSISSINITDLSSSLQGSISNVSSFFQACWSLFPPALWTIILAGLSLIVVLRVLGR